MTCWYHSGKFSLRVGEMADLASDMIRDGQTIMSHHKNHGFFVADVPGCLAKFPGCLSAPFAINVGPVRAGGNCISHANGVNGDSEG